jgi:tetratricopeptide (TPR) repeat protein
VLTAAGIALTLVAATTISLIQAHRARVAEMNARDEKVRADEKSAIAQAVTDFMQTDLLGQADISQQSSKVPRDRDVTVRALLDRASGTISRRFAGQPLVEAAIHLTVGDAYRAVGQLGPSREHLARAVELRQRHLGADHPDTLDARTQLALTALAQGQFDEAEKSLRDLWAVRRETLGPNNRQTLRTMMNVALVLHERGRHTESDELVVQAYDGLLTHYGPDDIQTITAQARFAIAHFRAKRYEEAESVAKDAINRMKDRLGADHPTTITSLNNLAMQYSMRDKYKEADPYLREVLKLRKSRQGPEHPATLESMRAVATNCLEQEQFEEGEALLREALAIQRRVLPSGHPETLMSMNNLGEHLQRRGRLDEAEATLREAADLSIEKLGPLHTYSRHLVTNYVIVQERRGRPGDAEPILRKMFDALPRDESDQPLPRAEMLTLLARTLLQQDKFAEAESLARAARDLRKQHAPGGWPMYYSQVMLGCSLTGLKRYPEAEPLLRESIVELEKLQTKLPPAARSANRLAITALAELLTETGRADEAAEFRKRLPPAKP